MEWTGKMKATHLGTNHLAPKFFPFHSAYHNIVPDSVVFAPILPPFSRQFCHHFPANFSGLAFSPVRFQAIFRLPPILSNHLLKKQKFSGHNRTPIFICSEYFLFLANLFYYCQFPKKNCQFSRNGLTLSLACPQTCPLLFA